MSDEPGASTIELTAAVDFKRRGVATKMVLPGLAPQNQPSRCDPALIKAVVRGRAWFEELATGRVRSLEELAKRDGITRRYIRRLVDLAFLSPLLVDAILQGRHPVALTATRLSAFGRETDSNHRSPLRRVSFSRPSPFDRLAIRSRGRDWFLCDRGPKDRKPQF